MAIRRLLESWLLPAVALGLLTGGVYTATRTTVDAAAEARNARLKEELDRVRAGNARLQSELTALQLEVQRLRSRTDERLYHARTQLGMVRPDEVVYQLDAPSAGERP